MSNRTAPARPLDAESAASQLQAHLNVHVILDNCGTYKIGSPASALARAHFAPTVASW